MMSDRPMAGEELRSDLADDFCELGILPERIESWIDGKPRKLGFLVFEGAK